MTVDKRAHRLILDAALRDGTRGTLYWYPVDINGPKDRGVTWYGCMPIVPVGEEVYNPSSPMTSQHEIHLVLEIMKTRDSKLALRAELTRLDILESMGIPWFIWGSQDYICPYCGAIIADCIC